MPEWRIPLSDLDYGFEEEAAVSRVLRSRWLSMGPEVEAFEREFAEYIGTRHAIAVSSGTAALHLTYLALGLGPGDEVIQPAINFVAAANMTVAVGASPIFADIIDLDEPTISPTEIEQKITRRTRAVVAMHYAGYPCRMAEIQAVCKSHNLALVEDACHAVGGRYKDQLGRPPAGLNIGNLGDAACFSFFSNKNIAIGEGGMITTNRDDIARRARLLRSHGMTTMTWDRHRGHANSYEVPSNGYNYRLDEIRASLGRCQLTRLNGNNERRADRVSLYRLRLGRLPEWTIPFSPKLSNGAYHLMVMVAPDVNSRSLAANSLREAGIQTSVHYPCVADFEAFARFKPNDINKSRTFAGRTITLPLFPSMTNSQVEVVCSNVLNACRQTDSDIR